MDRFRLECFVALAEELHFHRAAERCHVSQPAMSQQVRNLERELGVQLAHRTKRTVVLTPAGEVFLREARKTLRQLDLAVLLAQRTDRGEIGQLTVGVTSPALYVLFPEAARLFHAALPRVGMIVRELTTAEQEKALRAGDIDVGLIHPPLDDTGLRTEEVARAPFHLALPNVHPLARSESLELAELAGQRFVIFPRQIAPQLYDTIISMCQDAGFSLEIAMEAYPAQSIIALVSSGVGLGFIAGEMQRLNRPGVVYRPLRGAGPQLSVGVAHHPDGVSPAVEAFVDAARAAGRDVR
ncbi:LysR family transcriptional regulator [Pseudonocardia hierapolitana]|uniref:LysR family transcriptional regulator n=1 Tax=Pseudonocardia hierapolitana TaxID=1128676 RepID=A0A561T526_9PSEU|nr:LysR family transcriptional regulator [Pseudonocardia hierapolitana]TWF82218.1 LysR family transcriptional regulator [Pseudonocardia hierapolitana]